MDSRSAHFRDWLADSCGYHFICCARAITPNQAIGLIGAYIDVVAATPYNRHGDLPMANTLSHYAQAAFSFLRSVMTQEFSIFSNKGPKPTLVPFIGDRIAQRRKWQKPRPKREPYTYSMLSTFNTQITSSETSHPHGFLRRHSLVFDTQCLGIFTGSRVSEYAQSKGAKSAISRVPCPQGSNPTSTSPSIAFMASDFVFLSSTGTIIPHWELFLSPSRAVQMQITFRHDKSGRNFAVRKYGRGRDWLCPITAATRLLYRASILGIPRNDPICAYRPPNCSTFRFLRDTEVTDTMRQIAVDTYPDPQHFLRVNLNRFASHSNRVTAAVALSQSGMTVDDIAQRLRWKPESVAFYLRESAQDIGDYTSNAIAGAQRNFC
jgi:hypothetical protein